MRASTHQGIPIHPNGTGRRVLVVSRQSDRNVGCGWSCIGRVRRNLKGWQGVGRVEIEDRYRTGLPGCVCKYRREVIQRNHLQAKVGIAVGRGFHRSSLIYRQCSQRRVTMGLISILSQDPFAEQPTSVRFHPQAGRQLPILSLPWTTR